MAVDQLAEKISATGLKVMSCSSTACYPSIGYFGFLCMYSGHFLTTESQCLLFLGYHAIAAVAVATTVIIFL